MAGNGTEYLVKLKWAESYCTEYNTHVKGFSSDRKKAKVMDYETAEAVSHAVGGVVLACHEVFDKV
jgi:hypothetical protein